MKGLLKDDGTWTKLGFPDEYAPLPAAFTFAGIYESTSAFIVPGMSAAAGQIRYKRARTKSTAT